MLDVGYWRGASTLVAGPSGAGKTLIALHFVFFAVRSLESGASSQHSKRTPPSSNALCRGSSWSLKEPKVELMFRPPVDLYLDEWVYELLELIERTGAKRVAIDSLGDLRAACGDEVRFREYIYSFLQRCVRRNVSVILPRKFRSCLVSPACLSLEFHTFPTMWSPSSVSEGTQR
jgi:circadian clock protein KaiC